MPSKTAPATGATEVWKISEVLLPSSSRTTPNCGMPPWPRSPSPEYLQTSRDTGIIAAHAGRPMARPKISNTHTLIFHIGSLSTIKILSPVRNSGKLRILEFRGHHSGHDTKLGAGAHRATNAWLGPKAELNSSQPGLLGFLGGCGVFRGKSSLFTILPRTSQAVRVLAELGTVTHFCTS